MQLSKSTLNTMNKRKLIEAAAEIGLRLDNESKKTEMIDAYQAFAPDDSNSPKALNEKKVKITFHEQEGIDGKDDIKLGYNGVVFQVKRGVQVEIPEGVYLGPVKGAVKTAYDPIPGKPGEYNERQVNRFNYSLG